MFTSIIEHLAQGDTDLMLFLNGWHTHFWNGVMQLITTTQTWILFFIALLLTTCRSMVKWNHTLIFILGIILVIGFADHISVQILRPFFQRMRPGNLDNPICSDIYVFAGRRGGPYGFPSAHAANTFGLAFFFMWTLRNKWVTLITMLWAVIICYTRIYLGKHYPGDLLFGATVGFTGATTIYLIMKYVFKLRQPEKVKHIRYIYAAFILTISGILAVAPFLPSRW